MTNTPFDQGSQAFMNEASTGSCHFPHGSTMQREWMQGWTDRQVSERAHRARAVAALNLQSRFADPSVGAMAPVFRPVAAID